MAQKTKDSFAEIQKGQVARMVYTEVSDIVLESETAILNHMIANYAKLSNEALRDGIVRIAALRALVNKLDNQIQKGIEAQHSALSTQDSNSAQAQERYS